MAKKAANDLSDAQSLAETLPQPAARPLIFSARGIPIVLTNLSIVPSVADCSLSIMAVSNLANFTLLMSSTYFRVRSMIARSTRLKILYHTFCLSASFLVRERIPTVGKQFCFPSIARCLSLMISYAKLDLNKRLVYLKFIKKLHQPLKVYKTIQKHVENMAKLNRVLQEY